MPQRHRHGYAAGFHRGLLVRVASLSKEFPTTDLVGGVGAHRIPAHIRQVGAGASLRGFSTLVPLVHRPVVLTGPG
jgi:hypothetical protein